MKIVFLDFDGVLITPKSAYRRTCSAEAIAALNHLIEAAGAAVVVTSTWRLEYSEAELTELLRSWGMRGQVLGVSPEGRSRAEEIQAWMDGQAQPVSDFVILDDMSDMGHLTSRLIVTEFETGLTHEQARQALELFD
jgi:phosphoglycolate phosphatase-like HAD superfamily hydrolase